MNRGTLQLALVVLSALFYIGCGCDSLKVHITQSPTTITAGGTAQVTATVTHDSHKGGVNWSCTPVGACGSFNPTQTASGTATTYTAPATAGTVTLIATSVDNDKKLASVSVTVTGVASSNYVFYLIGEEFSSGPDAENFGDVYSLAGTVAIANVASDDGSFAVTGGVQDYNDGDIITSPQPGGDMITGGSLVIGDNDEGTLTLVTNNANVGVDGTETLSIVFVNGSHALIAQFDSSATSSGSLDLQTVPSGGVSGAFSFTLSGTGTAFVPVAVGGVFSISGTSITNGSYDLNDAGAVTFGNAFTGTITVPPTSANFGRGTITPDVGSGLPPIINFYVVGAEAIRLIDVDTTDTGVGSGFGQGDNTFSNTSISSSAFGVSGNSSSDLFGAIGEIYPTAESGAKPRGVHSEGGPATNTFIGVADDVEPYNDTVVPAGQLEGDYFIESNGYGRLAITNESLGDVSLIGLYAVDPTLNIMDPNNPGASLGGFVLTDLDTSLFGTGVMIPQSDIVVADFSGPYALGAQGFAFNEFDLVGQGTMTSGVLAATAEISDPFSDLGPGPTYPNATIGGTATPDGSNLGRYTMPAAINLTGGGGPTYPTGIYQASGIYLFWLDEDATFNSVWVGTFQQQAGSSDDAKPRTKH